MKKNNKITPEIHKEIIQTAKDLPMFYRTDKSGKVVYTTKTTVKKWEELSEEELKQAEQNKAIKPGKSISISKKLPVLINHEVMLIEAYKSKGREGIDVYVNHCNNLKRTADENAK